jgi:hypothetical protein
LESSIRDNWWFLSGWTLQERFAPWVVDESGMDKAWERPEADSETLELEQKGRTEIIIKYRSGKSTYKMTLRTFIKQ